MVKNFADCFDSWIKCKCYVRQEHDEITPCLSHPPLVARGETLYGIDPGRVGAKNSKEPNDGDRTGQEYHPGHNTILVTFM